MANVENLKLVRLFTGEDIMGEILETNDKFIVIKNPVRVVVIPSKAEPDKPGVGLAPFSHWTKDKEVNLYVHVVMAVMNPISEFVNQYNAVFGGLVISDNKLIVPGK
jgi:hypothetical protein